MEEFYTIRQVAIALKVHPLTIRRYIKQGKLKAYKAGGNVRVAVNDLRSFTSHFAPRAKTTKTIAPTTQGEIESSQAFSFDDPMLALRGKGLSLNKTETE